VLRSTNDSYQLQSWPKDKISARSTWAKNSARLRHQPDHDFRGHAKITCAGGKWGSQKSARHDEGGKLKLRKARSNFLLILGEKFSEKLDFFGGILKIDFLCEILKMTLLTFLVYDSMKFSSPS